MKQLVATCLDRLGKSQRQLSEFVGKDANWASLWLSGKRSRPSPEELRQVARLLECDLTLLLAPHDLDPRGPWGFSLEMDKQTFDCRLSVNAHLDALGLERPVHFRRLVTPVLDRHGPTYCSWDGSASFWAEWHLNRLTQAEACARELAARLL